MAQKVESWVAEDGTKFHSEAAADGHDVACSHRDWIRGFVASNSKHSTEARLESHVSRMVKFAAAYEAMKAGDHGELQPELELSEDTSTRKRPKRGESAEAA